jgi:nitric oxide reductase subunit B
MNLAMITYAMPYLRKSEPYNQILNMISFWLMAGGMSFMTITLTFAGIIQTHLQRVNGEDFMSVQEQLGIFYWMRLGSGIVFVIGALLFIYATFGPKKVRA